MWPMRADKDRNEVECGMLDELCARLVISGLPSGYVKRYFEELREHHHELVEEALAVGKSQKEALATADERLGGVETLTHAAVNRIRHATFGGRHPWMVFGVGSFLAVPICFAAVICAAVMITNVEKVPPDGTFVGWFWRTGAARVFNAIQYVAPCLVVMAFYRAAQRRMLGWKWSLGICLVVGMMGACCQMGARVNGDGHGNLWVSMGIGHWFAQPTRFCSILLAAWIYARWSERRGMTKWQVVDSC
jgi:hypothetical protein